MKKLLVVDGNGLVHRGFHALPDLRSPDGRLTNAVYGFFLVFLKALGDVKPDYICASFDLAEPTFRHKKFEEYKAHRPKVSDELYEQIPLVKESLSVFGVPIYEKEGFEADDVIATISEEQNGDLEVVIVSGDLDTLQLVSDKVSVYTLRSGMKNTILYDEEKVRERYGFPPSLLDDYRGLKGDSSDNIPGVKGVGKKTATKLLQQFGSLEEVYENIDDLDVHDHIKKKLLRDKEKAFFSKELATVRKDVSLEFDLEDCSWDNYDKKKVEEMFLELGFKTLIDRLPGNRKEQEGLW